MSSVKRTQVYMPVDTYRRLEVLARRRRRSVAHLVREAVAQYMRGQPPEPSAGQDPLWDFLAREEGHQSDGAAQLDRYLYGKDPPKTASRPRKSVRR
ncbi:MAG: CopG family transcriptional regulator [Candidatus Riflebacteria bacterium]|nr:CopG family transcriptional regulator [Candidatus Riflebacteria bacterium]